MHGTPWFASTIFLSSHSPKEGQPNCLQLLNMADKAPMNFPAHVHLGACVGTGDTLQKIILKFDLNLLIVLQNCCTSHATSSTGLHPYILYPQVPANIWHYPAFSLNQSKICKVISHYCFNLHFSDY